LTNFFLLLLGMEKEKSISDFLLTNQKTWEIVFSSQCSERGTILPMLCLKLISSSTPIWMMQTS